MYTHAFATILCGVLIPPLVLASTGNLPATPRDSMLVEAQRPTLISAAPLPNPTFSTTLTPTPTRLSQTDVMTIGEHKKPDYLESVTREASRTDPSKVQPSARNVGPDPEETAPNHVLKKEKGRVDEIRSIVSDALADPRPGTVDEDAENIAPPEAKQHRQRLQEAVINAPPPKDSPGDNYISTLKDEVSTTVVVEEGEAMLPEAISASGSVAQRRGGAYIYTVHNGDSLWNIAIRVYGNGHLWESIYDANRDTIANPDRIMEGQRLKIQKE